MLEVSVFADESIPPFPVISSKEFRLIDENGRERAILGIREGNVGLFLLGKDERIRLNLLLLTDDSPGLLFTDVRGIVRAKVIQLTDDVPVLTLSDKAGHPRLMLTVMEDGRAAVMLLNDHGNIQGQFWINDKGMPTLDLSGGRSTDHSEP
jgi:hypothetical protein